MIMRRVLYSILFCFISLSVNSQNNNYAEQALEKYKLGIKNFNSKNYQEAIKLFEECEKLSKLTHNIGGKSYTSLTANAYEWRAAAYYRFGDEEKAKELDTNYRLQPVDMAIILDAEDIFMQGLGFLKAKDLLPATKNFQKAFVEYEKVLGHDHQYTATAINMLGVTYFKSRKYAEALKCFEEARDILHKIDKENKALDGIKANIKTCQQSLSKNHDIDKYYDEGVAAYHKKKYADAIIFLKQCDSINKINKRQMPYYSSNANEWIAACYYQMGNKTKANELNDYFCQFTPIDLRKCPKTNELLHKFMATNISRVTAQSQTELLNTIKEELGTNNTLYANTLALIAYKKYHQYAQIWEMWKGDAANLESDYLQPAQLYMKQAQAIWRKMDKSYANQVRIGNKTIDMTEETKYNPIFLKDLDNNRLQQDIERQKNKEKKMDEEADLAYKQGIQEYKKGDYKAAHKSFGQCVRSNGLNPRSSSTIPTRNARTGFYISSNAQAWLSHCEFISNEYFKSLDFEDPFYTLQPLDQTTRKGMKTGEIVYSALHQDNISDNSKDIVIKALKVVKADQFGCAEYAELLQWLARYWESKNCCEEYAEVMSEYFSIVVFDNMKQAQQITDFIRGIANKIDTYKFMSIVDRIFEKYEQTSVIYRNSGKVYAQSLQKYYSNDADAKFRLSELGQIASIAKTDSEVKRYIEDENNTISKGLFSKALILTERTLREMKSYYGETSSEYIEELSRERWLLDCIGENDKSMEISDSIIHLKKQSGRFDKDELAKDYIWKANLLSSIGEYEEAFYTDSIALNYTTNLSTQMKVKTSMASTLYQMKKFDESILYNNEVIDQYHKNPILYAMGDIGNNYYLRINLSLNKQKYNEAFKDAQYLMKLRSYEDPINERAIQAYELCAITSYYIGDIFTFISTMKDVIDRKTQFLKLNFGYLTSQQRNLLWSSEKYSFDRINRLCLNNVDNPDLLKIGYDAILMSKSILLSSEIDFSMIINKSGDSTLIKKYQELKQLEEHFNKVEENVVNNKENANNNAEKQQHELKQLKQKQRELEQMLLIRSKEYGDFTRKFSVKWTDVSNALKDEEIAVEFFIADVTDESYFGSFVLRKGWDAPRCILLGKKAELEGLTKAGDLAYMSKELSDKVWGPILKTGNIKPSNRIYFATDDIFLKFGIEYLPTEEGSTMSEEYQMCRLSSTREICFRDNDVKINNAYLFGGAIYDAGRETLKAEGMEDSDETRNFLSATSDLSKGGVTYLPGTKTEVENIKQILCKNHINTVLVTDSSFSECTMKKLSGKNVNLLHISTHGFYWTKTSARNKHYRFLQKRGTVEQVAMTHSGLILSGSNHILTGNIIPYTFEDGIITSMEIGKMDLSHTQLAVLSACQTGLGVTSADGVFGLQRGFKKAGVKCIVMSLWEVDDEATQLLMTSFYEKLVSGMSKREAFVKAQQFLRTTQDKKFDNPRYWASFIMLDAL